MPPGTTPCLLFDLKFCLRCMFCMPATLSVSGTEEWLIRMRLATMKTALWRIHDDSKEMNCIPISIRLTLLISSTGWISCCSTACHLFL